MSEGITEYIRQRLHSGIDISEEAEKVIINGEKMKEVEKELFKKIKEETE